MSRRSDRRQFLRTTGTAALAAASMPVVFPSLSPAIARARSERLRLACIGTGSRWDGVGPNAMAFADCMVVCDVDGRHRAKAQAKVRELQGRDVEGVEDYREVLDRDDIDVVTIVTPDHWHTKIAIDAMRAGKDVYCEKPLTLTIEEGKQIIKVLEETGRVFQVGTQQRSEMGLLFLNAICLIRDGRIGDVTKATVAIGGAPASGPIPKAAVPAELNWEKWLGQAPMVDYRESQGKTRCHYEFRWWYEYSGGKMTDWGAHHVDIAQWGMGLDSTGPVSIEGTAVHPVPFEEGRPQADDQYNTATEFRIECRFADGQELTIRDSAPELGFDNGILFEGSKGRLFVNRGKLTGKAVEELADRPLPEDAIRNAYKGRLPQGGNAHMQNFFECIETREQPISDVWTHHRAMTTCHLANIAIRLGRPLKWDPETQHIVGDEAAAAWERRSQREGYEIDVQV